jgi:protein FRG1
VKSLDDGTFTLGAPHKENEPPSPEEIFTAIRINEDKIAIKSGYGKYWKVDKDGEVVGRSDAVGAPEQWEPIFEEGKMALLGSNGCFMLARKEDDCIVATSKKAGPENYIKLRCQEQLDKDKDDTPSEEKGNLKDIEVNYIKKFQKFQDKKMRINQDSLDKVLKAKEEGKLHESLLDRRAKMKADRYCK